MKRWIALLCALILINTAPTLAQSSTTLPPVVSRYAVPVGDTLTEIAQTVQLSLPSAFNGQLMLVPERMLLEPFRHPAEAVVRKLLSYTGSEQAQPLWPEGTLQLNTGSRVEISGDVATVDLSANALMLDVRSLHTVSRAIANTLTQLGDIRYVNILVAGQQQGVDTAATFPVGSFRQTSNEDALARWENVSAQAGLDAQSQRRFSAIATLYFPVAAGRGVAAEARALTFAGQSREQMAVTLIQALEQGAQTLPGVPRIVELSSLLSQVPQLTTLPGTGEKVMDLHFLDVFNEKLIEAGIPRSVMMASLALTLTTFIPGIAGVRAYIGAEAVTAVVPAGTYEGSGTSILFEDGIMRRAQFSPFLLTHVALYFANGNGTLTETKRPVPFRHARNARYLLAQLMEGPHAADSVQGLHACLPQGLNDAAIVGVSQVNDAIVVNFSGALLDSAKDLPPTQERQLVYGIVNTLTSLPGVKRVSLFIEGQQPETLAGSLFLPGEFLRNPEIIGH